MSCGNLKNCNQQSCETVYNNTAQAVTASLTTLNLLGSSCCDTGCSITKNASDFTITSTGLYRVSASVTLNPTGAGTEIVQIYKNGVALPCAISQVTTVAAGIVTIPVETTLYFNVCCNNPVVLTVTTSGVAGTVTNVKASAIKLS